ncbi:hypothetical protein C8J57DRAFT_1211883 [Mycena rebaudengoi]|nr:hypothetical protein C8J57DRAFT_1211883 [Mycena rebaudengoi]
MLLLLCAILTPLTARAGPILRAVDTGNNFDQKDNDIGGHPRGFFFSPPPPGPVPSTSTSTSTSLGLAHTCTNSSPPRPIPAATALHLLFHPRSRRPTRATRSRNQPRTAHSPRPTRTAPMCSLTGALQLRRAAPVSQRAALVSRHAFTLLTLTTNSILTGKSTQQHVKARKGVPESVTQGRAREEHLPASTRAPAASLRTPLAASYRLALARRAQSAACGVFGLARSAPPTLASKSRAACAVSSRTGGGLYTRTPSPLARIDSYRAYPSRRQRARRFYHLKNKQLTHSKE